MNELTKVCRDPIIGTSGAGRYLLIVAKTTIHFFIGRHIAYFV